MALYNITTKKEFEDKVVKSTKVVLVDFWADWCPPCRAMAPILHQAAEEHDDIMDVVKIDIEDTAENRDLAIEHGVQSIPNMPVFYKGKEVERIVGTMPKSNVVAIVKNILAKKTN